MKQLLLFAFTKLLLSIRFLNECYLLFCFASAFYLPFRCFNRNRSCNRVSLGFYSIYHNFASNQSVQNYNDGFIDTAEKNKL